MKKEIRKAVSRLRRAQDAVFTRKASKCNALDITSHFTSSTLNYWAIYCHVDENCQHWIISHDDTAEEIENTLQEVAEFISYHV